ncbi:MAG: DUF2514 family protein [Paucibacter sp.]|nr:DUF2514 family protein [Roseateles sp.]
MLALALLLAGSQWLRASHAQADAARITAAFADYRETQERGTREALQRQATAQAKTAHIQQEAIDAEYLARVAAEAAADRLRAGSGQLQRYAADLAASLGDRARDSAAAESGQAASTAASVCPILLGRLDDAAAAIATVADSSRRAGELCQRHYEALSPP